MATVDEEVLALIRALENTPLADLANEAHHMIVLREEAVPETAEQRIDSADRQIADLDRVVVTALKEELDATVELRELAPRFGVERIFLGRDPDMLLKDSDAVTMAGGWDRSTELRADGVVLTDSARVEAFINFIEVMRAELEVARQRVREREGRPT